MSSENDIPVLGGGGLGYVVQGGEVYIKADDLSQLFAHTGAQMGVHALLNNDQVGGAVAHALLMIAEKTDALRSETMRQEIEASFAAEFIGQIELDLGLDEDED